MLTHSDASSSVSAWRTAVAYAVMLVAAVGVFFAISAAGEAIPISPAVGQAVPDVLHPQPQPDLLLRLLIALAAVILTGRALGWAFRQIGQPPVIGEVVAGILLGPSLF